MSSPGEALVAAIGCKCELSRHDCFSLQQFSSYTVIKDLVEKHVTVL